MTLRRATITSMGRFVPEKILTNSDLEKLVDTSDEWIMERTGIRERHIVDKGMATSDMAAEAARIALSRRGIEPEEVQMIVLGTVTPDMMFPSTACLVQDKIGASRAWGFDVSAACCGFVYALTTGVKLVESGAHDKVLVIGADTMSSILNYKDRTTCVLFGDGAGAVLVEPSDNNDGGFLDFSHRIEGRGGQFLHMPGGGSLNPASEETVAKRMHYVHQDGRQVFKYAVRKGAETALGLLARNNFKSSDVSLLVAHQANSRIIDATAERLSIPQEKVIKNIHKFGNTTAGTIPLVLCDAEEEGRLKEGDLILVWSVGAGFTIGCCLIRWTGLKSA